MNFSNMKSGNIYLKIMLCMNIRQIYSASTLCSTYTLKPILENQKHFSLSLVIYVAITYLFLKSKFWTEHLYIFTWILYLPLRNNVFWWVNYEIQNLENLENHMIYFPTTFREIISADLTNSNICCTGMIDDQV